MGGVVVDGEVEVTSEAEALGVVEEAVREVMDSVED